MNDFKSWTRGCTLGLISFLVCATACTNRQADLSIRETRSVPKRNLPAQISDQERFGWQGFPSAKAAGENQPPAASEMQLVSQNSSVEFEFATPEGWREIESTQFRNANFVFGEGDAGQCYVTVLSGSGGGVAENVNRWRGQMGLPRLSESEMSDLPTMKVLAKTATYLELKGDFKGMGGQGDLTGAMLVGALLELNGRAVFIKMVGPAALVSSQRENFKRFCASLKFKAGSMNESGTGTQNKQPEMNLNSQNLPPGHPPLTGLENIGTTGTSQRIMPQAAIGSDRLKWTTPKGWQIRPNQQMRAASFKISGKSGDADCGVFLLPGVAGGLDANINRWRQQMTLPVLSTEELARLPETQIASKKGKLVELKGTYKGMGTTGQAGYMMLGVICDLDGESLFVKLTGPEATVQQTRETYLKFCSELTANR